MSKGEFMKLMSKVDTKQLQNLMRRKYTYEADAIFQFLCVNEELQRDARYKTLYEDLFDYFLTKANIITESTDFAKEDLILIAKLKYKHGQTHGIVVDTKYLDKYLLEYDYKKSLFMSIEHIKNDF